jgi:voltage-gated potassium channel
VILGAGRGGRATGKELLARGTDDGIVDRNPERIRYPERYILGDAAGFDVLERAGIMTCSAVVSTTHDDDINIYLAINGRRWGPKIQIPARANQDRNVSTLHRAGADFVLSYASTGVSCIWSSLKGGDSLLLAEELDVFRFPVLPSMVGCSLAECRFRQRTGRNVVALEKDGEFDAKPSPASVLTGDTQLVIVVDAEAERKFFEAMNLQTR